MILKNHQSMLYLINVVLRNVISVLEEMEHIIGSWETVELNFSQSLMYTNFSALSFNRITEQCSTTPMKDGRQKVFEMPGECCDPKIGEDGYMKLEVKNASPSCPLRIVSFNFF